MTSRLTIVLMLLVSSIQTANASFGRTVGNFNVSATGSTQYAIPIWAPPGPRGIQPNVSLFYDSQSSIGPLGIGWSLAGLGQITRCNKTYAQDTAPAPVALVVSDGYCLNGKRLRLTSGTYGTDGSTYQTEIADFSNITAHGTAGNGPAYFTVQGRNGNTYQYGFTDTNGNGAGSQVLAAPTSTASAWLLSKAIDRAGNNFVINYTTLTGTAVPANILWTPTSAGASTYTYEMMFNYGANVAPSSITKYIGGTTVSNSDLLSSISISASGTVIKDYFFDYQVSPTTGRDELISVQECADSAKSNCLLATNVTYQNGEAGVANPTTASGSTTNTTIAYSADMDGDGKQDLIYAVEDTTNFTLHYWVQFSTGSSYGAPVDTGIVTAQSVPFLINNFDGTIGNQILTPVSGVWYAYKWNPTSKAFAATSTGIAVVSGVAYASADMDGDGRPDLAYAYAAPDGSAVYIAAQFNTTSAGTVSFGSSTVVGTLSNQLTAVVDGLYGDNAGMPTSLKRMDFDGDGRSDLLVTVSYSMPSHYSRTIEVMSRGTGPAVFGQEFPVGFGIAQVFPVNWNDDACTDLVFGGTDQGVWVSQCNGTQSEIVTLPVTPLVALDWDGDGRTDLLANVGGVIQVYRSLGNGVAAAVSTGIPAPSSGYFYSASDIDGDGLDDIVFAGGDGVINFGLHNGAGQPPDLAIDFYDGFIVKYTAAYVALSQVTGSNYTKGTSQVFPQQDYDGPMYVTQYALIPNGVGTTYTLHYDYTGAVMNLQGRGFQGFTTVNVLSDQVHFNDTKTYSTGTLSGGIVIPTAGMLLGETVITTGGTNVRNAQYTLGTLTLDGTSNNQRYFPYTASSTANIYEIQPGGSYNGKLITTTATNYNTPDIYGNFSDVSTTVTDADTGSPYYNQQWTTTTATTISASPSTWCNSLPTERDVTNTAPGVPAITRHLSLTPDYSFCRETQQVVESGNSNYQVTTGYAFDAFGNINSQTVTGIGMAARTTGINWGTTGQFPSTITNALNQTTLTSFDPNSGKLLSVQDPNGIVTSWQYDPFERKSKAIRPDGTSTTWAELAPLLETTG